MVKERWEAIPYTDGVAEASTQGRIRTVTHETVFKNGRKRIFNGKVLSLCKQKNGYLTASVKFKGKNGKQLAHRLVALAFHKTDDESLEVLHGNNIKIDNAPSNLKWGTHKQNVEDAFKDGIRKMGWEHQFSKHSVAIYMQIFYLHGVGVKRGRISKMLNLPSSTVYNIMYNYDKYKSTIDKMFLQ